MRFHSSTRLLVLQLSLLVLGFSHSTLFAKQVDRTTTQGWSIAARAIDADFSTISEVVWNNDGSFIAEKGSEGVAVRDGKTLKMRHFLSRAMLGWTGKNNDATATLVAFVGNRLGFAKNLYRDYSNSYEHNLEWRDVKSGRVVAFWRGASVADDGESIFFCKNQKQFRVFHLRSQRWFDVNLPLRLQQAAPDMTDPAYLKENDFHHQWEIYFSPDGLHAADQIGDGRLRLWDVKARRLVAILFDRRGNYLAWPGVTGPVAWSPDGDLVATLGEDPEHYDIIYDEGPNDGTINEHPSVVKVWNARAGKLLQWWRAERNQGDSPNFLRWLDNHRLAVGYRASFEIREGKTKRLLGSTPAGENLFSPQVLSPDNRKLVAAKVLPAASSTVLTLYRVLENAIQNTQYQTRPSAARIASVAWSSQGTFVSTTPIDGVGNTLFWSWNKRPQRLAMRFSLGGTTQNSGWTQSGRFWTGDFSQISFYDPRRNWKRTDLKSPVVKGENQSSGNSYSPLFITSDERTVLQRRGFAGNELWRWDKGKNAFTLWIKQPEDKRGTSDYHPFGEQLSPDGRFYCASASENGRAVLLLHDLHVAGRILRLEEVSRAHLSEEEQSNALEWSAIFSRDGKRVAFGGLIFSLPDGKIVGRKLHLFDGKAVALSSHGNFVIRLDSHSKQLGLWLFSSSGRRLRALSRDIGGLSEMDFSPDNETVAVARFGDLEFYDVATGTLRYTAVAPQKSAQTVSSSSNYAIWPTTSTR